MDVYQYDAQADTININDITTNDVNRNILNRMQSADVEGQSKELWISNEEESDTDYRPEAAHDMGWLGYFVGRHEALTRLCIGSIVP